MAGLLVALLGLGPAAQAAVESNWSDSPEVPDNHPDGLSFSFYGDRPGPAAIESAAISLSLSGGWNGDLYACLAHGSGLALLSNRSGTVHEGANGDWNLFLAGLSPDSVSTLRSWNASMEAKTLGRVKAALGTVAAVTGLAAFLRSRARRALHVLRQPRYVPA